MNFEELEALLGRARQGPLGEEDYQELEAAIQTLSYLIELIGEKETTISRLRPAGEAEHGEDAQSSGAGRARIPSAQR